MKKLKTSQFSKDYYFTIKDVFFKVCDFALVDTINLPGVRRITLAFEIHIMGSFCFSYDRHIGFFKFL